MGWFCELAVLSLSIPIKFEMIFLIRYTVYLVLGLLFFACQPERTGQGGLKYITPPIPQNLADSLPYPDRNPFSEEGIALGKMLFFDPALSKNGQVSCASCHMPERAFTDGEGLNRRGVSGEMLFRHVPTLANVAFSDKLFWDGGANDLESMVFAPLTHADEMAQDLSQLPGKLADRADYRERFRNVFGEDTIRVAYIARALAQFQRTIISGNSPYDQYIRGENNISMTEDALAGMVLVKEKCGSCHPAPFFTDYAYHNNGLDSSFPGDPEDFGMGRFRVTLDTADIGKYKTPTLRNIMATAPYMHDGRFLTIDEVLDHYTDGIKNYPTVGEVFFLEDGGLGLPITEIEKKQIIAFLHTLTDSGFLQDPNFKSPLLQ